MSELDALHKRLDRLERERWWTVAIFLAPLLIGVVAAWNTSRAAQATKTTVVETERLVIRDASGKVRAVLGVEVPYRGWPQLPASMTKGQKQPPPQTPEFGLFIYNTYGAEVAHLTDWAGEGAYLQLTDQEQQGLAQLMAWRGMAILEVSAKEKGLASSIREGEAVLKRAEGERWGPDDPRWKALPSLRQVRTQVKAIGSMLSTGVEAHSHSGLLALYSGGIASSPALHILDQRSSRRVLLGVDDDGAPRLQLFDANGRTRAALGRSALEAIRSGEVVDRPESSLVLFDKDGKVSWKSP